MERTVHVAGGGSAARCRAARERGRARAAALLFSGAVAACGLPDYPYLAPPKALEQPIGQDIIINLGVNTENNPQMFEGFELYYKLYVSDAEGTGADTPESDNALLGIEPTDAAIKSRGYRRLFGTDNLDELPPLVRIRAADKTRETTLSVVGFNLLDVQLPHVQYGDIQIKFGRLLTVGEESVLKGFGWSDFSFDPPPDGDIDIPQIADLTTFTGLTVALYVFSYGQNTESPFNPIYSTGTYLGKVPLSIEPPVPQPPAEQDVA